MLSLDLFDSKFEKRLHEGAVDSTIEHLLKPLSLRAAEIRTQLRSGGLDAKQIDKLEQEYEDLVQKRLDIILDRRPQTEQQQPQQQPPAKGLLKGKDLVTPQQRVAGATPAKPGMAGAVKDVVGNFKRWLQGRDDIGPTYESVNEQDDINKFGPPQGELNVPAQPAPQGKTPVSGPVILAVLANAWDNKLPYADLPYEPAATVSRAKIYDILITLKKMNDNQMNKVVHKVLGDRSSFLLWSSQLKRNPTPVERPKSPPGQMKLFKEAPAQKKNSKNQDEIESPQNLAVQRYLTQVRRKHPAATSDIEAIAKDEMERNSRTEKTIADLKTVNRRQDAALKKAQSLDRQQGDEIDDIEKQIGQLSQKVQIIKRAKPVDGATSASAEPKTQTQEPETKPAAAEPSAKPVSTTKPASATTISPAILSEPDKRLYDKVQDLEKQIKQKTASGSPSAEVSALQQQMDNLKRNLQKNLQQIKQTAQGTTADKQRDLFTVPDITDKSTPAIPKKAKEPEDLSLAKDLLSKIKNLEPVDEHGGGIGPRQHWQSMMRNEGWSDKYGGVNRPPTPYGVYIDGRQWKVFPTDDQAQAVANKVRANLKRQGRNQTVTIAPSQEYLQGKIKEEELLEGIRDTASATAVIACLLTGGSLTGCATAPQQTTAQQVLKTGQDVGRTIQTAKNITRAGVEAEVNQEIRNLLRGMGNRPEELNNSNILRIWRKIKGQPPVQPEPDAPENQPAPPRQRMPQYEAKEIHTREDFIKERDRLLRMIAQETNPANRQILKSAIRQLEGRAENEGWISLQQRMIREDNASKVAEQAILKRIFVAHRDLLINYGPEKVMQAAEEVSYNVGDLGEIGSSDVSGWVQQVKQILGATA